VAIALPDSLREFLVPTLAVNIDHSGGLDHFKTILGAVPLAPPSEAAMPVAYQLMRTGSGDAFDLKGEIDVFKHTVMAAGVQMLYQSHGILGVTVVADRSDLCDGFHCVWCCLYKSYIH
jgi:hypothetical protein